MLITTSSNHINHLRDNSVDSESNDEGRDKRFGVYEGFELSQKGGIVTDDQKIGQLLLTLSTDSKTAVLSASDNSKNRCLYFFFTYEQFYYCFMHVSVVVFL